MANYRVTFPAIIIEVEASSREEALDKACEDVLWLPTYDLEQVIIEDLSGENRHRG